MREKCAFLVDLLFGRFIPISDEIGSGIVKQVIPSRTKLRKDSNNRFINLLSAEIGIGGVDGVMLSINFTKLSPSQPYIAV